MEPIDRTSYKQWTSDSPQVNHTDDEQQDQSSLLDCLDGVGDKQTAESYAEAETTQLSFAEVMRLVQEGKEVPGVKRLEVKPSNQTPTPSQMGRVVKPWETSWGPDWRLTLTELWTQPKQNSKHLMFCSHWSSGCTELQSYIEWWSLAQRFQEDTHPSTVFHQEPGVGHCFIFLPTHMQGGTVWLLLKLSLFITCRTEILYWPDKATNPQAFISESKFCS